MFCHLSFKYEAESILRQTSGGVSSRTSNGRTVMLAKVSPSFNIKNKFNHGNGEAIHEFVFDHAQNAEKSLNRYFKSWKTKKNCSRSNKKRKNRQGKFLVCTYKSHKLQKSLSGLHSNSIYMM